MHTGHDQELPQTAEDGKAEGTGQVAESLDAAADQLAGIGADGRQQAEPDRQHDQQGQQRIKRKGERFGDHLFEKTFDIAHDPDAQQRRQDTGGVIGHIAGNAVDGEIGAGQGREGGQHQDGTHQTAHEHVDLELLSGRDADEDGHEVEEGVIHDIGQHGEIAVRRDPAQHTRTQKHLNHANQRSCYHGRHQLDHAPGSVFQRVVQRLLDGQLFLRPVEVFVDGGHLLDAGLLAEFLVRLFNIGADDNLKLPGHVLGADHAVDGLDLVEGDDALVLQPETQARSAVHGGNDIVLAADGCQNVGSYLVI